MTGSLFLLGLRWGPVGVAVACVTSFTVLTIPALWYAGRPAQLDIASIIAAVWKYVLASALAGGASALIIWEIPSFAVASGPVGTIGQIVAALGLFGALYLCAVTLFHRGYEPIRRVARLVRDMGPAQLEAR